MRARGAKVTDIAVLVVAADDGVMPQTRESISHARAAEVPIVVAVNKIDLPDANPDRVLAELATEGLQPEEWGGTTQVARVSAKQGEGLDDLLEKILLVADARARADGEPERRGLRADHRVAPRRRPRPGRDDARPPRHAQGRRRDRRRRRLGPRARALRLPRRADRRGAGPASRSRSSASTSRRPPASSARVVENESRARELAQQRGERLRREALAKQASRGVSLEKLFEQMQAGGVQDLNIVIKGDVQGSVEAIVCELAKIDHSEVRVNVIHTGVGGITENDVNLAAASNAMVVGFNVRPVAGGAAARRAAGDRDPPVPRHLRAHARRSSRRSSACSRRSRPRP